MDGNTVSAWSRSVRKYTVGDLEGNDDKLTQFGCAARVRPLRLYINTCTRSQTVFRDDGRLHLRRAASATLLASCPI
jgi:hypothetical protein